MYKFGSDKYKSKKTKAVMTQYAPCQLPNDHDASNKDYEVRHHQIFAIWQLSANDIKQAKYQV
jgi:hypothetical protein